VADYGRQIAAGLAAAHERGLIHRDVNLRNVLVAPDGRLKVTDFGIAKMPGVTALTQTGLTIGTAVSMAPEQAQGEAVTPATDVYGLGVVLYQLATGRPPFTGDSDVAVAVQHVQAPVVPPRELNPALPAWLEEVILRALAKDPADRYPDGAAIAAGLVAGLTGQTTARAAAVVPPVAAAVTTPIARQGLVAATAVLRPVTAGAAAATGVLRQVTGRGITRVGAAVGAGTPPQRRPTVRRRQPGLLVLAALVALLLLAGLVLTSWGQLAGALAPSASATVQVRATAPGVAATATRPPPTPTPPPPTATPAVRQVVPAPPPAKKDEKKKGRGNSGDDDDDG
jgi:hypothetical protein